MIDPSPASPRRLFIGLPLPPPIVRTLGAVESRLRAAALPVRWEEPQRLHITVCFLGATPEAGLPPIVAALQQIVPALPWAELRLGGLGGFPTLAEPRTVWAGVAGDLAIVYRLQQTIAAAMEALGYPQEARPFHAHVTVGRVNRGARRSDRREIGRAVAAHPSLPSVSWRADRVVLFESLHASGAARYVELAAVKLRR